VAWQAARNDVQEHGALEVPRKLRNAATKAMKSWGYGQGYRYPHDEDGYAAGESYLPDKLADRRYYAPTEHGHEAVIAERLRKLRGEQ
jgi:putative ATPase